MMALVLVVVGQTAEFQRVREVDGVSLDARAQPGSDYSELRFRATTKASVAALCEVAFGDGSIPKGDPWVRQRRVLSSSGDERVTYERVNAPIVSDRDYVLRTWRTRAPNKCVVNFIVIPDATMPVREGVVRVTTLRGEWRFESSGDGTTLEYITHAEPGGGMPAFIVEGPKQSTEFEVVRRLLAAALNIDRSKK